jgi:hypothetical protein
MTQRWKAVAAATAVQGGLRPQSEALLRGHDEANSFDPSPLTIELNPKSQIVNRKSLAAPAESKI